MSKHWDGLMKMVAQASPQDLVSWILTGAVYQGELNVELQKKDPISADKLYTVKWGGKKMILHVEFQHKRDPKMGKRLWQYNALAGIHTDLPVCSVVIYIVKRKSVVDPPYEVQLPTGFTVHQFHFLNIKLWEIQPEVLKQPNLAGLLPLLPLTKGGKSKEVVEEAIQCLLQAGKDDLIPLAYGLAALLFKKGAEQEWLKERFDKMEDISSESWAYKEMVQKGIVKGLEQGKQQGLEQGKQQGQKQNQEQVIVRFVEIHFPDLVTLARQQVAQATTLQQLQEMLDQLFLAHSEKGAKAALLGKEE